MSECDAGSASAVQEAVRTAGATHWLVEADAAAPRLRLGCATPLGCAAMALPGSVFVLCGNGVQGERTRPSPLTPYPYSVDAPYRMVYSDEQVCES